MTVYRYTRHGSGIRTGKSWPDARPVDAAATDLGIARAGDSFLFGFDRNHEDPVFWSDTILPLARSGAPNAPIAVSAGYISQPDNVQPSGMQVNFRLSGEPVLKRAWIDIKGPPFLELTDSASNIQIRGFGFSGAPKNGFICFGHSDELAETFSDIGIKLISGTMAGRVIETREHASVRNLVIEDCDAMGLVRGFARFHALSDSVIRNTHLQSGGVDGGGTDVAQMIHVLKGSHVRFENIWLNGAVNGLQAASRGSHYTQGDGIVTEADTSDFVLRNCHASGMGDGGFDLKTSNFRLEDCSAHGCKLGVRVWSHTGNQIHRCSFTQPTSVGGQAAAIWCGGSADVVDCRFQAGSDTSVFRFGHSEGGSPHLRLHGGEITMEHGAALIQGVAGTLELHDVVVNGDLRSSVVTSNGGPVRWSDL